MQAPLAIRDDKPYANDVLIFAITRARRMFVWQ
jgi:hypothetical protein